MGPDHTRDKRDDYSEEYYDEYFEGECHESWAGDRATDSRTELDGIHDDSGECLQRDSFEDDYGESQASGRVTESHMGLDGSHDDSHEYYQGGYNEPRGYVADSQVDMHGTREDGCEYPQGDREESPPNDNGAESHDGFNGLPDEPDSRPRDYAANSHMDLGSTYEDGRYHQAPFDNKLLYSEPPPPRSGYHFRYFNEHDRPLPRAFHGSMSNTALWMGQESGSALYQSGLNYNHYPSNAGLHFKGQHARENTPRYIPTGNKKRRAHGKGSGDHYVPTEAEKSIRQAQILTETLQAQSYSTERAIEVRQPEVRDAEEDHQSWRFLDRWRRAEEPPGGLQSPRTGDVREADHREPHGRDAEDDHSSWRGDMYRPAPRLANSFQGPRAGRPYHNGRPTTPMLNYG